MPGLGRCWVLCRADTEAEAAVVELGGGKLAGGELSDGELSDSELSEGLGFSALKPSDDELSDSESQRWAPQRSLREISTSRAMLQNAITAATVAYSRQDDPGELSDSHETCRT